MAELAKIETQQLRQGYQGKRMAKADKRVISKARVITGAEIIRLRGEREARDTEKAGRAEKKTKPVGKEKEVCQEAGDSSGALMEDLSVALEEVELSDEPGSPEDSWLDIGDFSTPVKEHASHPRLAPKLNTPANPNRRLPDRPLAMHLRSRN